MNEICPSRIPYPEGTAALATEMSLPGTFLDLTGLRILDSCLIHTDMFFPGNWIGGKGLEWNFGMSDEIPLDLVFEIGAVDARLDLSSLKVRNLALETGASSTRIMLPKAAGMTHMKVEAGAASVEIEVPDGVEARIDADAGLASLDVDQARFPKTNGIYQSAAYDTAENKVDIRIETGVSSIEIR